MPLLVPSLTFSTNDKGVEFLTKDQVTRLIDDMQRAHTARVAEALKPVQAEVTRLEAAHQEAEKKASKAADTERELGELRGRVERRDAASELLGLTDSNEIEDLHGLYQSRTAGLEADKRPAFKVWVEGHLAKPEEAPALVRPLFEQAAQQRQGGQGGAQQQRPAPGQPQGGTGGQGPQGAPRVQVQTGGGRVQPGGGAGPLNLQSMMQARAQGTSPKQIANQRARDLGRPLPFPDLEKQNG